MCSFPIPLPFPRYQGVVRMENVILKDLIYQKSRVVTCYKQKTWKQDTLAIWLAFAITYSSLPLLLLTGCYDLFNS